MSTDPIEGTVIAGKYQLIRLLGRGGMGAVYEGRNTATLKRCAVKLLLAAEFGGNADLVKRFFREAKASSIVESDHIVQVYDSGYDTQLGWPYMVMEMLHGRDLEHLLKEVGALHPLAAAKVVLQSAMGLAKAHEAGIIHRDIKPANLFLTTRETGDMLVKLLDFGIAKVRIESVQETSTGLTRTGSMLGTPLYMSPQQVAGASNIDATSDVWSLGIVLFELLSGQIPWRNAGSLGMLMSAILNEDIPLLQDRAPWVPPELAEITHRAISRDPAKRFRNASELRDALASIIPDGPRITPELVQSVQPQHRAFVAPRLAMSDDGMLRATTRSGLSATSANATTATGAESKPRRGTGIAVGVGLSLLLGGGVLAYAKLRPEAPPAAQADAPKPAPLPASPATAAAPPMPTPALKHFFLSITPAQAQVTIDDKPVATRDGKVEVEGVVGATPRVKLSFGGSSEEFVVAIAETGVVPAKLDLAVKQAQRPMGKHPSGAGKVTGGSAPAAPPAAKPPEPKPAVKQDSGLNRNVDEFGK